jgi:hypothetical protein
MFKHTLALPENQAKTGENKRPKFTKILLGESKQNAIHLGIKKGKAAHTKYRNNDILL